MHFCLNFDLIHVQAGRVTQAINGCDALGVPALNLTPAQVTDLSRSHHFAMRLSRTSDLGQDISCTRARVVVVVVVVVFCAFFFRLFSVTVGHFSVFLGPIPFVVGGTAVRRARLHRRHDRRDRGHGDARGAATEPRAAQEQHGGHVRVRDRQCTERGTLGASLVPKWPTVAGKDDVSTDLGQHGGHVRVKT